MRNFITITLYLVLIGGFLPCVLGQNNSTPIVAPLTPTPATPPKDIEINTLLMKCTFLIAGVDNSDATKTSFGTCFVLARPDKNKPSIFYIVLITAGHVMENIGGSTATLMLRRQQPNGLYTVFPYQFNIRDSENKPLWTKNPDVDVAVMYISLPSDIVAATVGLSTSLLADDSVVNQYELHPGDQLFCLGYPYGQGSPIGNFPILRGGTIASYPLTPAKTVKQIMFDFPVFPGNSGGPVYISQVSRQYGNIVHLGESEHFVVGIVIKSTSENSTVSFGNTQVTIPQPLSLATIIPAQFILDTVNMLPDIPKKP